MLPVAIVSRVAGAGVIPVSVTVTIPVTMFLVGPMASVVVVVRSGAVRASAVIIVAMSLATVRRAVPVTTPMMIVCISVTTLVV